MVWELFKEFRLFQDMEGITELTSQEPIIEIVHRTRIFIPDSSRFPITVQTLYSLNIRLMNLTSTVNDECNSSGEPLNALLSVTAANTALPLDQCLDTSCTPIYNSVDFPANNLPLNMTVDRNLDAVYESFKPFSPED